MGKHSHNKSRHRPNGGRNPSAGSNHQFQRPSPHQPRRPQHQQQQQDKAVRTPQGKKARLHEPRPVSASRAERSEPVPNKSLTTDHAGTNGSFSSRKRSLTKIAFVYPKKNGAKEAYLFENSSRKRRRGEDAEVDARSRDVEISGETKAKPVSKSLDDILYPNRRRSLSEDSNTKRTAVTLVHTKEGETSLGQKATVSDKHSRSESLSTSDASEGHLSGRSVEDAVRDSVGCRPRSNSTDFELNLPQRGLCDERTVLESYRWRFDRYDIGRSKPKGFNNLGNTCFLNSTLQCLAYIPPFCQSLLSMSTGGMPMSDMKRLAQGRKVTVLMKNLFTRVHASNGASAIPPRAIVSAVPSLSSCGSRNGYKFRPGRQEDAHEFLVHLLDAMNDGELRQAGINQHKSGWRDRLPIARLDETTFIHRNFGGYFRSQVRCTKCDYKSNTYDPFLDLSLEVSKKSCNSVLDALKEFTRKEKLDNENRWKCSGCNKHVCAIKELTVFRPPLVLCIQLKRFTFSSGFRSFGGGFGGFGGGQGGQKVSKPVDFPSVLNLPLSDGRSCRYALTGVVIHLGGSATSGHYTSCIKRPKAAGGGDGWFHMDDSFAEPVSESTVLRQKDAYLLFYSREEVKIEYPSPPLRGSMTAEEATELGRSKSLARAQSNAEPADNTTADCKKPGTVAKAPSTEKPPDKTTNGKAPKAATSSNQTAPQESSSSSDSESGESSESSSSSEEEKPGRAVPASTSKSNKEANAKSSKRDLSPATPVRAKPLADKFTTPTGMKASKTEPSAPASSVSSRDIKSSNNEGSPNNETDGSESSGTSSSSDSESSSGDSEAPTSEPPDSKEGTGGGDNTIETPKKGSNSAGKQSSRTLISLERGKGREKVSVMLGPRFKSRGWTPGTVLAPASRDYQLLGNVSVDKWGDDDEDTIPAANALERGRTAMTTSITDKQRNRKKRMYLDRWDAALDEGRKKKVKSATPTTSHPETQNHRFQKIQASVQKMNRGRAKGTHRPPDSNEKRRY